LAKTQDIEFSLVTGRTKIMLIPKKIKKLENTSFLKVYRLGPTPVDVINGALMVSVKSVPRYFEVAKFASLYREAIHWKVAQTADIFHIHGIWSDLEYIFLGLFLSRRFQKPLVLTLHGGFVGDPLNGGMPLDAPIVKYMLENDVAAITTYSKEILSHLQQMGLGEKSFLVTNFVDTYHFKNSNTTAPPRETTIIYVGRMERVQTPDLVIKAFKIVHQEQPNAKLVVVGYGTMFEELKAMVKDFNLESNVSLVGKQSDVRPFLWSSDIFVATNFGYIASLEAWSAGLAVVAPNFGILKEAITHETNGLLFEPNSPDSLASALIRLINDKELREKLAAEGAREAKNYDIRSVAPKMTAVYHSVL
jgi:glycosyltransferase involved in cell wall biosynthesis